MSDDWSLKSITLLVLYIIIPLFVIGMIIDVVPVIAGVPASIILSFIAILIQSDSFESKPKPESKLPEIYIFRDQGKYGEAYYIKSFDGYYRTESGSWDSRQSNGQVHNRSEITDAFKEIYMTMWSWNHIMDSSKARSDCKYIKELVSKMDMDLFSYTTGINLTIPEWDEDTIRFYDITVHRELKSGYYTMSKSKLLKVMNDYEKKLKSQIESDEKFIKEFYSEFNINKYIRS